ncbi:MAG: hypothetical protein AUK44_10115 [Porphyromonadaceae bacterium CG2_30_38_12]|nr:MAG: hypothetical protein AUK44_10115 [Porphyromonadaceae bacterium CG2_30_38_12]
MKKLLRTFLRTPLRGAGWLLFFSLSLFSQSYGGRGWVLDSTLLDARFPAIAEWAKAGVEGGIPDSLETKIAMKITPKANLQKAINKVAKKGGVLLLLPGEYTINEPINLHSGVILRGISKESVILSIKMHGYFWRTVGQTRKGAVLMHGIENAGVENITLKYAAADFEPNDRNSNDASWCIDVFHKPEKRDTTLFVESIWIHQSRNCYVQNCNILWSGSDPIRITLSDHITCRRNYIDRCYNKNDGGMGYYNISNSRYVLICNEKIRRIRHLAIQNFSKYNVIIDNDLEVDINFHDGDAGFNLVQGNRSKIPTWHSWEPISVGVPKQHLPPGDGNILYNNQLVNKAGELVYSNKGAFYQMNTDWNNGVAKEKLQNVD